MLYVVCSAFYKLIFRIKHLFMRYIVVDICVFCCIIMLGLIDSVSIYSDFVAL